MPMGFQSKSKNRMANSVDSDEMAHYEPSHLDLHCLHRYWAWSAENVNQSTTFTFIMGHLNSLPFF